MKHTSLNLQFLVRSGVTNVSLCASLLKVLCISLLKNRAEKPEIEWLFLKSNLCSLPAVSVYVLFSSIPVISRTALECCMKNFVLVSSYIGTEYIGKLLHRYRMYIEVLLVLV